MHGKARLQESAIPVTHPFTTRPERRKPSGFFTYMPQAAVRPCAHPGCGTLTTKGRCEKHRIIPDVRGTRQKKYDKRFWRDGLRMEKLRTTPLCEDCEAKGLTVIAHHVDHKDGDSNNDQWENLRSLCAPCHSRKTVLHDGGFGNVRGIGGEITSKAGA